MFNSHFKEYYEYLMSENYSFITKVKKYIIFKSIIYRFLDFILLEERILIK